MFSAVGVDDYIFKYIQFTLIIMIHINVGELQEHDLFDPFKLLYVRDRNPVALALQWCDEHDYDWLSLPDAIRKIRLQRLVELAPSLNGVHFQKKEGAVYQEERVTSELSFNSYVLTQLVENDMPIEQRIRVYVGHGIPMLYEEIADAFQDDCPFDLEDPEYIIRTLCDVTRAFTLTGHNGIPWLEAKFKSHSGTLEDALFGDTYSSISQRLEDVRYGSSLCCLAPKSQGQLCTISMDNTPHFRAFSFFNRSDEFANYFIVGKKSEEERVRSGDSCGYHERAA